MIFHDNAATIFAKILGAIAAVISLRWFIKIFAGKDGKLGIQELYKMVALVFFTTAGAYMLWKEGQRDHEWSIYSEWYIAIVFGALLTVLHLDHTLDKIAHILSIMKGLKSTPPSTDGTNDTK